MALPARPVFGSFGLPVARSDDNYHRFRDPRMMTEAYFESVLEKYDELAEADPMD